MLPGFKVLDTKFHVYIGATGRSFKTRPKEHQTRYNCQITNGNFLKISTSETRLLKWTRD